MLAVTTLKDYRKHHATPCGLTSMRNLVAGFLVGYWMIGLVTLPLVLTAVDVVPSYPSGVTLVLDRSGVFAASRYFGFEATHLRNLAMNHANQFLGATIFAEAAAADR